MNEFAVFRAHALSMGTFDWWSVPGTTAYALAPRQPCAHGYIVYPSEHWHTGDGECHTLSGCILKSN